MDTIAIPRKKVKQEGGVVILSLEEYRKLSERAVPTYYLRGKAAERLDKLVERGLREYREGKVVSARSLGEAMKMYAKKNKRG